MQGALSPLLPLLPPPGGTCEAHLPVASAGGLVCLAANKPGRACDTISTRSLTYTARTHSPHQVYRQHALKSCVVLEDDLALRRRRSRTHETDAGRHPCEATPVSRTTHHAALNMFSQVFFPAEPQQNLGQQKYLLLHQRLVLSINASGDLDTNVSALGPSR